MSNDLDNRIAALGQRAAALKAGKAVRDQEAAEALTEREKFQQSLRKRWDWVCDVLSSIVARNNEFTVAPITKFQFTPISTSRSGSFAGKASVLIFVSTRSAEIVFDADLAGTIALTYADDYAVPTGEMTHFLNMGTAAEHDFVRAVMDYADALMQKAIG